MSLDVINFLKCIECVFIECVFNNKSNKQKTLILKNNSTSVELERLNAISILKKLKITSII